jgi:hypothetical protein
MVAADERAPQQPDIGRHEMDAQRMETEAEEGVGGFGGYNELTGIPYTREDNLFRVRLSSTDFRNWALEFIADSHFSHGGKRAMEELIYALFDRNVFYANITNQSAVMNKVEEMVITARLALKKTDVNRPELITLVDAIKFQFGITMTRTSGPHRERLLQRPEQRVVQDVDRNDGEEGKEGGGFFHLPHFHH